MTRLKNLADWWRHLLSFEALECGWPLTGGGPQGLFDGQWEWAGPGGFTEEEAAGPSRG